MDTTVEVDINDVERFANNPDFHYYLVNNTTDFGTAAFILQTILDKVKEVRQSQGDNA